ncbi:hypothetical protein IMG5_171790 [Ichthyophthirius multifiliis]|uniref:Cytochrome-b5 reductase n=1 Tax=Ichthyophthirius multifiliis TaxID=5932 RepID=G0R1P0_ICHMU|nr:hypothetical protein IMG5_171790 [Ichthyophthirius multifiliis]EGR28617.1 hypothetical protein IMG5_171790 [Ichthyophthirius multifiliis]|eukprot:XP_004029853.1 hypothetical protein IMG5_171790 [Ichthyophthirius multifiliis]
MQKQYNFKYKFNFLFQNIYFNFSTINTALKNYRIKVQLIEKQNQAKIHLILFLNCLNKIKFWVVKQDNIIQFNTDPRYPEGGKLTYFLDNLQLNSFIEISGPYGKFEYLGQGNCKIDNRLQAGDIQTQQYQTIFMIAGGTGITPMYQIIQHVCEDNLDNTQLVLLYANKTEEDILLRKEIENYQKNSQKLKIYYTLDQVFLLKKYFLKKQIKQQPPLDWKYFKGYINKEMIQQCFPYPDKQVLAVSCGNTMMNNMVRNILLSQGFQKNQYFKF